jgi:hypothetical protein
VLAALCACRTAALGTVIYECVSCGRIHAMHRSCGNRHCPTCQQGKAKAWLEKQTAQLLPCPYFLLTFTLPAALRDFVRSHQRACYAALFAASSEAIKQLAADPKHLGSKRCGFFGVLHTARSLPVTVHYQRRSLRPQRQLVQFHAQKARTDCLLVNMRWNHVPTYTINGRPVKSFRTALRRRNGRCGGARCVSRNRQCNGVAGFCPRRNGGLRQFPAGFHLAEQDDYLEGGRLKAGVRYSGKK